MRLASLRFTLLALVLANGCADPDGGDPIDDDFLAGGKADGAVGEGSPEALGVLAVVNTLDQGALDSDVGLDARAAKGIASHRAGADKALGTADDDPFDTLAELDAIPYVGKTAFTRLLAYAQANGFVPAATGNWQWENPGPDGTVRHATFALSASDAWAVGDAGLIEHWNGSTWTTVPSGTELALDGVWASAANDVWVVGEQGTVLRWNGTTFSAVPSGTTRPLYAVHGTSKNDVWVVGENDSQAFAGEILHWDGTQMAKKRTSACPNSLYSVFASAPNDVWVAGHVKTVCHYDGSTWKEQYIEDGSNQGAVTSIWRGASTTWAIYSGDVWRLDGTVWSHQFSLPRLDGGWTIPSLIELSGTSDTDIWASGTNGYLVHFDGSTWTPTQLDGEATYVGVSLSANSEGFAVGAAARARLHNGQWQESYDVVTRNWLWEASGTSATNIWALGSYGDVVRRTAAGWQRVTTPFTPGDTFNYAVEAISANDVWIGGAYQGGHWDGQQITLVPELRDVHALWSASATDVWAAGESGTLEHYDGTAWTKATSPEPYANLFGLGGTGPNDVWAIGHSLLMHYDGTAWSTVDAGLGSYEDWNQIAAIAPDDVWIAGESKNLKHYDGATWTDVPATTKDRPWFSSSYANGPDDVWFVLSQDELVHWNGTTLEHEPMTGAQQILGVGGHLWVTGVEGMIRHR